MDKQTTPNTLPMDTQNPMFYQMVRKMSGDMKFMGIVSIIYGALTCLSIIGAAIGIPMIFAGIRLNEAADLFINYLAANDFSSIVKAMEKQGRYFNIMKILVIVGICLFALYIVVIIIIALTVGFSGFGRRSFN